MLGWTVSFLLEDGGGRSKLSLRRCRLQTRGKQMRVQGQEGVVIHAVW